MSRKEFFIAESAKVHNGKYDYSLVEYVNAHTPVTICCPVHGPFTQKPVVHYNLKCGCQQCKGGIRSTLEEFISQSSKVHDSKYDYSLVNYVNNSTPVTIICKEHGEFQQIPKTHRKGRGCQKCNGGVKTDTTHFKNLAEEIHGDRYDYSLVNYVNNSTSVTIICKEHGEFQQLPLNHTNKINKSGCPICGLLQNANDRKIPKTKMIERIKQIFGDRYSFRKFEYKGVNHRATLICALHGEFTKHISNILNGQGCPECSKEQYVHTSRAEESIVEYIQSIYDQNILTNNRDIIAPYELDIYIPKLSIAIEYCGLRWHSETFGRKPKNYHINKLKLCEKAGIRLITIFEDEWINKTEIVKRRLKNILSKTDNKVYARKCQIQEITKEDAKKFLNEHHLQGYSGCRYRFGLYHNNELVSVMTFSKPNISKGSSGNNEGVYEINRFASSTLVIGGASKLLNHFATTLKPNKIISYCDLRWSTGNLYHQMNMSLVRTSAPNYWYIDRQTRIHRFALRKGMLPTDDPKLTEWENRKLQGYDRIWDCGNLVFEKFYLPNV